MIVPLINCRNGDSRYSVDFVPAKDQNQNQDQSDEFVITPSKLGRNPLAGGRMRLFFNAVSILMGGSNALATRVLKFVCLIILTNPVYAYDGSMSISGATKTVFRAGLELDIAATGFAVPSGSSFSLTALMTDLNSTPSDHLVADYEPDILFDAPSAKFKVNSDSCPDSTRTVQHCASLGTLTFSFSKPVKDPVLHFQGMSGNSAGGVSTRSFASTLTPTTDTEFDSMSVVATNGNLRATGSSFNGTNWIEVYDGATGNDIADGLTTRCHSTSQGVGTIFSGCGSVKFTGVGSKIVFEMGLHHVIASASVDDSVADLDFGESFRIFVTVDEDFGDAPASYNAGGVPVHIVNGLVTLGATEDEDNTDVFQATTSPYTVADGANNNSPNGDGADEDGVPGFPLLINGAPGVTYTVPGITVHNATGTRARLCGWVDFDFNGQSFAHGQSAWQ